MTTIAIDGPAGAGKSTIAKAVAKELNYIYVDTGALYRAIGLFAMECGIEPGDREALAPRLPEIKLELVYREDGQHVLLGSRDVSEEIRTPEMGMAASAVSAHPEVRAFLLESQRDMARKSNVVMDGRDIGTVVVPDANVKVFLTASPEERARRRHREHVAKGESIRYNEVLEAVKLRDHNDSTRAAAPLRQAEDAVLVDTTELSLEATVAKILELVKEREAQ